MLKSIMEYKEFRRQLGKAGLTNIEFADLVKIKSNSLTNYKKNGEVPSHWGIVALLMGHMSDHKLDFKEVFKGIEIKPNKTRGAATKGRFGGSKQTDLPME